MSSLIKTGEQPVCVISDHFFSWAADVSHEFGVFNVIFSTSGGFGMACYHSLWLNLPHRQTDSKEFQLPDFPEAGNFEVTQLSPALLTAGEDDPFMIVKQVILRAWSDADVILFNTVEEMDRKGLNSFRRRLGIPVWGIGPTMLSEMRIGRESTISSEKYKDWMDKKKANERNSVAAFISHCGWNSVLESLVNGVPMLGWPMAAEQFYNVKLLQQEIGVCVQLVRGLRSEVKEAGLRSEVKEEDILEKIKSVVGENKHAKDIRRKSMEIKEITRDAMRNEDDYKGSSVDGIENLFIATSLE